MLRPAALTAAKPAPPSQHRRPALVSFLTVAATTLVKAALSWDSAGYTVAVDGQAPTSFATPWPTFAFAKMASGRGTVAGGPGSYGRTEYQRVTYRPARLPTSVP